MYATITRLSEPDTITSQLYRWKIQAITANPALVSRKHRCVDSYVTATAEQVYQHIDVCGKQGQDLR